MTNITGRTLADAIGARVARKLFESRGNHSEIHLSESQLAQIAGMAAALMQAAQHERGDSQPAAVASSPAATTE